FLQQESTNGLNVLWIEGTVDIGKFQFIEELRFHCAFEHFQFAIAFCGRNSSPSHPVLEAVRKLAERLNGSSRDMFPSFMFEHFRPDSQPEPNYPLGKLTSDLVGILATIARETRLVLAIENIEEANPATIRF